ncbi:MAG TPA: amidase family protein [Saprospiraceae bacterium]|nr:amidase family protein [Saprospiraceae bacterium]
MTFSEYRRHDALGLAELIRKREVSAAELMEIAIRRTEEVNPALNAVIHKMYDEGRKIAAAADPAAPFAGQPFLIKDLGLEVKGFPIRTGCKGYEGYISSEDSFLVRRFREVGLAYFGKTNTPEFGLTPYTEPQHFGPTRNPWNTARSAGGSSGGSAAAVAAGIVPMATASDGGGSIRIPASCNGLFGIKPTRGRLSLGSLKGEMWSGAVTEGCVSRSVRDSAAFLDILSGPAPGEPYIAATPARPFLQELEQDPRPLRIGFSTTHTLGQSIDPQCVQAVQDTVVLLQALGHQVEEVPLPFTKEDLKDVFTIMVFGEVAADLDKLSRHLGRKVTARDVEPNTYALGLLGNAYSAKDFAVALNRWNDISRRVGRFHQQYDMLLTPTVSMPPFPIGALQATPSERRLIGFINALGLGGLLKSNVEELKEKIFGYIPFTPIANMTGQPSISVPLHWTPDGLPVGLMFSAAIGRDDLLFQLAGQLERSQPWFDKLPE